MWICSLLYNSPKIYLMAAELHIFFDPHHLPLLLQRLLFTNRQTLVFFLMLPLFPDIEACSFSFWIPTQRQVPSFKCILSMGSRLSTFVSHQLNWFAHCAGCILIFLIFLWKASYFGEQPNAVETAHKRRSTNGFLNVNFCKIKKPPPSPTANKNTTKTKPQKHVTGELIRPNPPTAIWSSKLSIWFI